MARSNKNSSPISVLSSPSKPLTTAPSSPPLQITDDPLSKSISAFDAMSDLAEEDRRLLQEEEKAALANSKSEAKKRAAEEKRRKNRKPQTEEERRAKAAQLQSLLDASKAFSGILMAKTTALGRTGTALNGTKLGEHGDIAMAKQPDSIEGTLRDYQLEGLTWMWELVCQGMSGILADEMGTGKTVQTISLIAKLRSMQAYGPHIIIVPMSTLSNWLAEFKRWAPSIPVIRYHGAPPARADLRKTEIHANMESVKLDGRRVSRPTANMPVVVTTYEIILRDRQYIHKIPWDVMVIDEGHRMKNFNSKLFRELRLFASNTRILLTGTPLQNNLKELWSLLNFLMPQIFADWNAFESWFDFTDLEDENRVEEFIGNAENLDLITKLHAILQPLMLRRLKADVLKLPPKREYVLYTPLVREQRELYRIIKNGNSNATRDFLINQLVAELAKTSDNKPSPIKTRPTKSVDSKPSNVFSVLMASGGKANAKTTKKAARSVASGNQKSNKRKATGSLEGSASISKTRKTARGRVACVDNTLAAPDDDNRSDDELDDDAFEARLAREVDRNAALDAARKAQVPNDPLAHYRDIAVRELKHKKLGNPIMQLRLVCNSVHNFYDPFIDPHNPALRRPITDHIVSASGKMRMLDRLLPRLINDGHRVLIFSQFKTQLDIIADYVGDLRGWAYKRIDGGIGGGDRQGLIDDFNNNTNGENCKVFLLSTRAGGQGLNLVGADTVILFDSDWNPQQDLQAQDRCHRIGQNRSVIVYRLVARHSVEDNMITSADAKRRLEKLLIRKRGLRNMIAGATAVSSGPATTTALAPDDNEDAEVALAVDAEALARLKEKDGEIYNFVDGNPEDDDTTDDLTGEQLLSDRDLDQLCDRSPAAYERARVGEGNAEAFTVVETRGDGIAQVNGKHS